MFTFGSFFRNEVVFANKKAIAVVASGELPQSFLRLLCQEDKAFWEWKPFMYYCFLGRKMHF